MKRCTIVGCLDLHWARGMCRAHYMRAARNGALDGVTREPRPAREWRSEGGIRASTLSLFPAYPRRTRDALSDLAERAAREGMTTTQYEREQARILGGQA